MAVSALFLIGSLTVGSESISPIDWEKHRYSDGVLCEFRPRSEYKGRAPKEGLAAKAGARFVLQTLWLMGDDEPYPGEYALSTPDSCASLMMGLGIAWVASGDVFALPNTHENLAITPEPQGKP